MEARASAEARGATRAGTGVFSGGRWDAVRVVFLHGGGVRGAGGGLRACRARLRGRLPVWLSRGLSNLACTRATWVHAERLQLA